MQKFAFFFLFTGACGYIPQRCLNAGLPIELEGGGRGSGVGRVGARETGGRGEAVEGRGKGVLTGGLAACEQPLVYVCMYVCMCIDIHDTYIYMYIYMYIHTHYVYIYTYIYAHCICICITLYM